MPTHHSNIGGSVIHRVVACPWSLANIHRAPPQETSAAAAEGTALHEALELYYTDRIKKLDDVRGTKINGVLITDEHMELLKDAGRVVDGYIDRLEEEIGHVAHVHFEAAVNFADRIPDAWGTCDVLVKCGPVLAVMDYKFGRVPVSAKDNSQLKFYAQAARHTFKWWDEITTVELNIIQPRAEKIHEHDVVLPEDLDKFEVEILAAIKEAEGKDPRCVTGSHCRFCPLEVYCPEKTGLAQEALREESHVNEMDLETLTYWMNRKDELESFLTSVRNAALVLLENGHRVPGWKLVARRATRRWENETKAMAYFKEVGLHMEDFTEMKLRSPAQMEKILDELPEELVVKKSSGVTVAPESDRRVDLNAQDYSALKRFAE